MRLPSEDTLTSILTILLVATIIGAPFPSSSFTASAGTTTVSVNPALTEYAMNAVGQEFTITVKIVNVTNLYGFDIKFRWNTTFLDYVDHSVKVPKDTYLDGVLWNPVLQLADDVNATAGTYWIAYSSMAPAPTFNGAGTVFNMTFRVKYQPVQPELTANITLDLYSTDLAAKGGAPIAHTKEDGTVILHQIALPVLSAPLLKVMPVETEKLPTNSSFNIDIWIISLNRSYDIANFSITLNFNSTLIKATSITEGSLPRGYAENATEILNRINNTIGTATYAVELGPKSAEPPTSGIVFTVSFNVTYESLVYPPPSCDLTLNPTNILDKTLGPIAHAIENSTYTSYRPPPIAEFTWSPSALLYRGQTITFNASGSHNPLGGAIISYRWDFGDGTKMNTTNPTILHIYETNGTMNVILNVTDYGGFWSVKTTTLHLLEYPPKPYLAVDPTYVTFGPYYPSAIGQEFSVRIYVKGLDAGWSLQSVEFCLSYNATLIDIMGDSHSVTVSDLWRGPNEVNVTRPTNMLGKVIASLQGPSITPSGDVLLTAINFTVKHQGIYPKLEQTSLNLSDIDLTGAPGEMPAEQPIQGQVVIEGLSPPVVKVEPSLIEYHENSVGKEFTVAVEIANVTNLYGFDLRLRWNTTVLEYVGHSVYIPKDTYSDGVLWNPVTPLEDAVNTTAGTYWIAYASTHPAPSFNGTGTVFNMTFRIKYQPIEPEPAINVTLDLYATALTDNSGTPITHTQKQSILTLPPIPSSHVAPTVTVIVGTHGSSNIANGTVNWGTTLNFVFTPDSGYSVADVKVNGTSVGAVGSLSRTITGPTTVQVSFAINTPIPINTAVYAAVGVVAIATIAIYFTKIRKSKSLKGSDPVRCFSFVYVSSPSDKRCHFNQVLKQLSASNVPDGNSSERARFVDKCYSLVVHCVYIFC